MLAPGTRLGPYEILSALGAGGMGQVYRARDAKLGRDVAIKVVLDHFTDDPERVARFHREARLLAALNHPHIATIHGLEESAGTHFLVMELVEGDTLADLLVRGAGPSGPGGLPLEEALTIARQIADALQAAHEKGIIHRDLKPANVALTADGQVKVLDFGLAKALDPTAGSSTLESPAMLTHSPTLSLGATSAGVILGTAAYMAPEQARGKVADKRSDIWAFGCVLYEMLTGRRPFDGEDMSDTMANILKVDPDWTALPATVPPAIRALLRRCLEKDRRKRVADIAAALFAIDEAVNLTAAETPVQAGPTILARPQWRRVAMLAAGALAIAIASATAVWFTTRPTPPRVSRTTIATSGATALSINGNDRNIAVTPDGLRVVYRGNGQILVRALDQLEPTALGGLGNPHGLFVSPDSQWVGYFEGNGLLKKVAITGGPSVTVATGVGGAQRGATWGDDGTIIRSNAGCGASVAEDARHGQLEAWKKRTRQYVARFERQLSRPAEVICGSPVNADNVDLGIDDPVLDDSEPLVQGALDRLVALSGAGRPDLHDEIWRAVHPVAQDLGRPLVRHVQQIRLDDIECGEDDVEGRQEDSSDRRRGQVVCDRQVQPADDGLVRQFRRRRHVVLSVDQLVPLPIFGKQQEVVVGELHARGGAGAGGRHAIAPGHALILARRKANDMPQVFPEDSRESSRLRTRGIQFLTRP